MQPTYRDVASRDEQPASSEIRSLSPSNVPDASSNRPSAHDDSLGILRKICSRFHLVVRQLRLRRDDRATLEVEDEYDVQDLLYALLRLEFERAVHPTPAGGRSYSADVFGMRTQVDF